jgi:hypothetical protein
VFPSVFVFKSDKLPYTALLFAMSDSIALEGLRERTLSNIRRMPAAHDVSPIARYVLENLSVCSPDSSAPILTDDCAPVESLTYQVLRTVRVAAARTHE